MSGIGAHYFAKADIVPAFTGWTISAALYNEKHIVDAAKGMSCKVAPSPSEILMVSQRRFQ